LLEELLSMIERFDFFFALLNLLSELVRTIKVFTDIDILSKLFDFFKFPVQINKFLVEDLFLVL
jgi:hypothetical protein